jgi:predicted transcriptional regulator
VVDNSYTVVDYSSMKILTLDVSDCKAVSRRALEAFKGRAQGARISFATPELLFRVLTTKRWEIVRAMTGAGPLSIRETARRVKRDVKAVHGDVQALLNAGILRKTDDGLVVFPFDAIRVDVMLKAA